MKNPITSINQSLANPKSFWIGVFLTSCLLFVVIGALFFDMDFNSPSNKISSGPETPYLLLIGSLPGLFLLAYGVRPESKMGKIGAVLFKFYDWLYTLRR